MTRTEYLRSRVTITEEPMNFGERVVTLNIGEMYIRAHMMDAIANVPISMMGASRNRMMELEVMRMTQELVETTLEMCNPEAYVQIAGLEVA